MHIFCFLSKISTGIEYLLMIHARLYLYYDGYKMIFLWPHPFFQSILSMLYEARVFFFLPFVYLLSFDLHYLPPMVYNSWLDFNYFGVQIYWYPTSCQDWALKVRKLWETYSGVLFYIPLTSFPHTTVLVDNQIHFFLSSLCFFFSFLHKR